MANPTSMKTFCLQSSAPAPRLIEREAPIPQPGPEEVLIRVHAAGVTPTEVIWYPTTHTLSGDPRLCAVPGHEFSGVVATLGSRVEGLRAGQEIYGMNDWFAEGATAQYCITRPDSIAAKPQSLSHAQAASVPIGALTAWQGLFDRANLRKGERVLVHGGSGAVGIFAVQLARRAGASVVTTASRRNTEFLSQLGSERVIDYHSERFEDCAGEVDVVFDCVGGSTLERSWKVLKPRGRMVTIAAESEGTQDERTQAAFFIVEPKQEQLVEIARLLDCGELKVCVDGILPLAQAPAAYLGTAGREQGRGKVVLTMDNEPGS